MRMVIALLALIACASTPYRVFEAPWIGASEYHDALMCAVRQEYGKEANAEEIINEYQNVVVEVVPNLRDRSLTVGRYIRIRAETTVVEREALWRHESVHWLEHRRTGRWTYYPYCSARHSNPNQEFLDRESNFNASVALCRKDQLNER